MIIWSCTKSTLQRWFGKAGTRAGANLLTAYLLSLTHRTVQTFLVVKQLSFLRLVTMHRVAPGCAGSDNRTGDDGEPVLKASCAKHFRFHGATASPQTIPSHYTWFFSCETLAPIRYACEARSAVFATTSVFRNTPIICSSVNSRRFIVPSLR